MSVIFQTLKKLQSKPHVAKRTVDKLLKNRRIYSIRKVAPSPLVVPTVVLLFFASGAFTVFSVHNLHETKALSPSRQERYPSAAEQKPHFLHPEPAKPIARKKIENTSREELTDVNGKQSAFLPKSHTMSYLDRSRLPVTPSGAFKGGPQVEYIPAAADANITAKKEMPVNPRPIFKKGLPVDTDVKSLSTLPVDGGLIAQPSDATSKPLSDKKNQKPIEEEMHRHAIGKKSQITRLVKMIKRSMGTSESGETDDLLDQLSSLKGRDDLYVLKLKAYWHIRQHRYQAADLLLKIILESDKNDLEAGINMAVVEIKMNRHAAALKRLSDLEDIYPENPLVSDLMWKLK